MERSIIVSFPAGSQGIHKSRSPRLVEHIPDIENALPIAQPPQPTSDAASIWLQHAALIGLSLCTLLVHGYHPFAEDGGLYVAGILYRLNPSLFPHDKAFVTAHLAYSMFSPALAALVRVSHLPLPWVLLAVYLGSIWTTLFAALRIARKTFASERAALFAVAVFAACFTLPIAGTSLMLMDPYVSARTLSTPLSLLAVSLALKSNAITARSNALAGLCLLAAAVFHPLMASYAVGFVCALTVARRPTPRSRALGWLVMTASAIAIALVVQGLAAPETAATRAADTSRYYWFPSQWQWFELLGLAGPLIVLAIVLRTSRRQQTSHVAMLCRACIGLGVIASLIAVLFAQELFRSHAVARLQPLRAFLLIYAVMTIMLGGTLASSLAAGRTRLLTVIRPMVLLATFLGMFYVQRQTFAASQHLELPWRTPKNSWSEAFVWARDHTHPDALFAIDARYITQPGEDAQTFRASAHRSVLADFSKDGGEAAITPSLAVTWLMQSEAQKDLSLLDDRTRDARLRPLGVTWMVLRSSATTLHACPYNNGVVKICSSSLPQQGPLQP